MSRQFSYKSVLAPYMNELISIKESCGQHTLRYKWIFNEFDTFLFEKGVDQPTITKSMIEEWRMTRINDSPSTLYSKYTVWVLLARYVSRHGVACFIPRMPNFTESRHTFTPYIFSHEQITNILTKSTALRQQNARKNSGLMCIPSVLRLLYSTGLRISEALSIRNRDIEFGKRHIIIKKTKNAAERLVPINDPLNEVLLQYEKYRDLMPFTDLKKPDGYFFINADGTPCTDRSVTWWFRILLEQCGIPYLGNHNGPRVHDLRHTFAVHSLIQMSRAGMDLYACLPIISTCLGHKSLSATERYVRLTSEMYPEIMTQCSGINAFVYPTNK